MCAKIFSSLSRILHLQTQFRIQIKFKFEIKFSENDSAFRKSIQTFRFYDIRFQQNSLFYWLNTAKILKLLSINSTSDHEMNSFGNEIHIHHFLVWLKLKKIRLLLAEIISYAIGKTWFLEKTQEIISDYKNDEADAQDDEIEISVWNINLKSFYKKEEFINWNSIAISL